MLTLRLYFLIQPISRIPLCSMLGAVKLKDYLMENVPLTPAQNRDRTPELLCRESRCKKRCESPSTSSKHLNFFFQHHAISVCSWRERVGNANPEGGRGQQPAGQDHCTEWEDGRPAASREGGYHCKRVDGIRAYIRAYHTPSYSGIIFTKFLIGVDARFSHLCTG